MTNKYNLNTNKSVLNVLIAQVRVIQSETTNLHDSDMIEKNIYFDVSLHVQAKMLDPYSDDLSIYTILMNRVQLNLQQDNQ